MRDEKGRFIKGNIPWHKGKVGVYSEEKLKQMSESHKGYPAWNKDIPCREETKQKLSKANKGNIPWNKGTKGLTGANKTSFKKGMTPWLKGKHLSQETKDRLSKINKERMKNPEDNPFYGKTHTLETRMKISEANKGREIAEDSPSWKGDNASYSAVHKWMRSHKPKPEYCEMCGVFPPKEVSNVSGEYKRDLEDYQWVCKVCHYIWDSQLNETKKSNTNEYSLIHKWAQRNKEKSDCCAVCGRIGLKLELSNINHEYNKNIDEFQYVCKECHIIWDRQLRGLGI